MPGLDTYELSELDPIDPNGDGSSAIRPGVQVRHRHDAFSYGVALSCREGLKASSTVCEVLWSRQPWITVSLQSTLLEAPLPAHAEWTRHDHDQCEDPGHLSRGYHSSEPTFDGREEYTRGQLSADDMHDLRKVRSEITYRHDGRIVVKRTGVRAHEMPRYMQHGDVIGTHDRRVNFRGP